MRWPWPLLSLRDDCCYYHRGTTGETRELGKMSCSTSYNSAVASRFGWKPSGDRSSFLTICSSSGDKLASWLFTVSSPWLISSCPTFWGWFYGLGWTVNSEDYRKAYHDGLVGWYPVCEGEPAWFCHSWDLCLSQGTEFLRVLDLSLVGQQGLLSLIVLGR